MRGSVENRRLVAARAHRVAGRAQLAAMRLVAVDAADAGGVHPALQVGPEVEHLVVHRAVGKVQSGIEGGEAIGIIEHHARGRPRDQWRAPRMTGAACLDVRRRRAPRRRASGDRRAVGETEGPAIRRAPVDGEPRRGRRAALRIRHACPVDVRGRRTVAGFAADAGLGEPGAEGPARGVVVLDQRGDVTVRALVVPILLRAVPVQARPARSGLAGIEEVPALALRRGSRVPHPGEGLQPPTAGIDEVLLQGRHTEGVGDAQDLGRHGAVAHFEDGARRVALGAHGLRAMPQLAAVEGGEHGRVVGQLHGKRVVRGAPRGIGLGMAAGATGVADEGGRRGHGDIWVRVRGGSERTGTVATRQQHHPPQRDGEHDNTRAGLARNRRTMRRRGRHHGDRGAAHAPAGRFAVRRGAQRAGFCLSAA